MVKNNEIPEETQPLLSDPMLESLLGNEEIDIGPEGFVFSGSASFGDKVNFKYGLELTGGKIEAGAMTIDSSKIEIGNNKITTTGYDGSLQPTVTVDGMSLLNYIRSCVSGMTVNISRTREVVHEGDMAVTEVQGGVIIAN